jgi:hypothetical protein
MSPFTFFLLFFVDEENNRSNGSTSLATKERYGPTFAYDEFLAIESKTLGFILSILLVIGLAMLVYLPPVCFFLIALGSQCSV